MRQGLSQRREYGIKRTTEIDKTPRDRRYISKQNDVGLLKFTIKHLFVFTPPTLVENPKTEVYHV